MNDDFYLILQFSALKAIKIMFRIDNTVINIIISKATGIIVSSLLLGLITERTRPPVLIMA